MLRTGNSNRLLDVCPYFPGEEIKLFGGCGFPIYWLWIGKVEGMPLRYQIYWVNFMLDTAFWTIISAAVYLILKKQGLIGTKK